MRALVTGGAGFIGSTLVDRLLAEGHAVDVVDDLSKGSLANLADARSTPGHELTFHRLDVREPALVQLLAHRRPEVVFHLAAQADVRVSVERPVFDAEVNVIGTINVLEAARAAGARKVVFATSGVAIYGEPRSGGLPVKESDGHRPRSPHGVAKSSVAGYLDVYRDLHNLEYTALALASVYGPGQSPASASGVVAILAGDLVAGRPGTIHGDGSQTRDFVYVDDVIDALARASERGSGLTLNIATAVETSIRSLHSLVAAAAGVDVAPLYGPARPGEVNRSSLNPGRAAIHLGWKPWTVLGAGVAATVHWVRTAAP